MRLLLLLALALLAGCGSQPNLDVGYELLGDEMYICVLHVQNLSSSPVKISRFNVNGEFELPLPSPVILAPSEKKLLNYRIYDWPRPKLITLETNQGIFATDITGPWPTLGIYAEMKRKAENPNQAPVPPPTPPSKTVRFTSREDWPTHVEEVSIQMETPKPTPTPEPSSTPTSTPPPVTTKIAQNPEYSGSFINQTSGESGAMVLVFERFIMAANGEMQFAGKLKIDKFAPVQVAGALSAKGDRLSFKQSAPISRLWTGVVAGQKINGEFQGKSFGRQESGIFDVSHFNGLSLTEAAGLTERRSMSESEQNASIESGVEFLAVPSDPSMKQFILYSVRQQQVVDPRIWVLERAATPGQTGTFGDVKATILEFHEK